MYAQGAMKNLAANVSFEFDMDNCVFKMLLFVSQLVTPILIHLHSFELIKRNQKGNEDKWKFINWEKFLVKIPVIRNTIETYSETVNLFNLIAREKPKKVSSELHWVTFQCCVNFQPDVTVRVRYRDFFAFQ